MGCPVDKDPLLPRSVRIQTNSHSPRDCSSNHNAEQRRLDVNMKGVAVEDNSKDPNSRTTQKYALDHVFRCPSCRLTGTGESVLYKGKCKYCHVKCEDITFTEDGKNWLQITGRL